MISKFAIWRKTQTLPILGPEGAGKTSVLSLLSKRKYEDTNSTDGLRTEAKVKINQHRVELVTLPKLEQEINAHNIKEDSPCGIILVVAFGFYPTLRAGEFPDIDLSERLARGTQAEIDFLEDEFEEYLQALDRHSGRDLKWVLTIVNKADLWWDRKNSVESFYRKKFQRVLLNVLKGHERTNTAMPFTNFLSCRTQSFLDIADPSSRFDDDDSWKLRDELNNALSEALDQATEPDHQKTVTESGEESVPTEKVGENRVLQCVSAKIVLVGESNVGKSCLAMRLAEDRYPEEIEMGTTHGMRFWPMDAEDLHPMVKTPKGQRRDVVLWDFGGQDQFHLVHQMFLHDTTLALVLIDPARGRAAMDEVRDWNKRLEHHLGPSPPSEPASPQPSPANGRGGNTRRVKLLVGAKVDKKRDLIDQNSIDALCEECGFAAFIDLSAKTGRNINKLRMLISDALDWDQMAKTSRPELFQHIRDEVERRRKRGEIVLTLDAFKKAIKRSAAKLYEEAAVDAVTDQLATQGVIVRTKLTGGDEALVLQLPVIERYAGSLIIAARNNPRGVPVLEERLLGSTKKIPLPGITKKERLSSAKERMVLECIVELMIQHGICFRHGGLLVFPTLFPAGDTDDEKLPHSVSLYYDFTGAIDNIYASLVSKLMVSEEFGEGRLRAGRVEFERGRQGICGVRQIKRKGGLAHMDLFFSEKTLGSRKDLFTRFVEEHLRVHGVDIREHQAIKCKCGYEISELIIEENIVRGESDVVCPVCRTKTAIGEGVDRIRQRSPETDAQMVALRTTIDVKLAEDIKSAKKAVAGQIRMAKTGDPIRILHLSDLHFTKKTNPETKLGFLLRDIRREDEEYAAIESVEYLVISGDMTDKGNDAGFEKARQFVQALLGQLGLSTQRCIFVPGNHDVQDREDAYEEREAEDGSTIRVRHRDNFPKRFLRFSDGFFHPLLHNDYPLNYTDQGISYLFPDTGIQFLTLNSAWEIDKNGRKKAGIHPDAVTSLVAKAEEERKRAVEREDLKKSQEVLRIGVWHHAVAGPELMQDLGFMTQLQKAGMRLCLHGDVHESRTELFGYRQPGIDVGILGAGSFGSTAAGRPESTPRLYNMLEVSIDPRTRQHMSIRVHTREQKKAEAAWQGYHAWPNPKGSGRLPFFDIDLMAKPR